MNAEYQYYGQPIRSLQTMLCTIFNQEGRMIELIPDGVYGQNTVSAVSEFQKENNLAPTGITDESTWNAICESYDLASIDCEAAWPIEPEISAGTVFSHGDRNSVIMFAQCILQSLGTTFHCLDCPSVSGVLDETSENAVRSFQLLCGLPASGCIDKCTWKHLAAMYPLACQCDQKK